MSDTKDIEAMLDDYVYALAIIDLHRATERSRASFHIEQRELWQRVVDRKQRLLAAFADLEGENRCDCCAGTGTPISGKPCMCGGTGKMSRAAVYLREQLIERDARIAELEAALSNIEAVTCDPEGNVCIRGSDGDRAVIQRALAARKGEQ